MLLFRNQVNQQVYKATRILLPVMSDGFVCWLQNCVCIVQILKQLGCKMHHVWNLCSDWHKQSLGLKDGVMSRRSFWDVIHKIIMTTFDTNVLKHQMTTSRQVISKRGHTRSILLSESASLSQKKDSDMVTLCLFFLQGRSCLIWRGSLLWKFTTGLPIVAKRSRDVPTLVM